MNFLLVVGKRGNQLSGPKIAEGGASVSDIQDNLFHRSAIEREVCIDQKLNVACRSIRRFAEEPAENDLRLAIGDPNPLAFLLSVACWVRRDLTVS